MSEKQTENNIDEIFRKGIEPLDTEPSEEFWRKSAENIIKNGSKSGEKKAVRWRTIAFVLSLALLLLGYLTFRMQNGLNNEKQQVAELKKQQTNSPAKTNNTQTTQNTNTVKKEGTTNSVAVSKTKKSVPVHSKTTITANKVVNHKTKSIKSSVQIASTVTKKPARNLESAQPKNVPLVANTSNKQTVVSKQENQNNTSVVVETQKISTNSIKDTSSVQTFKITKASKPVSVGLTPGEVLNPAMVYKPIINMDSLRYNNFMDSLKQEGKTSKFSISVYFTPQVYSGYKLTSNDATAGQYENTIQNGEKQKFSYSAGIKAEYALSKHFSIGVGIAYQSYSFQIAPSTLYAKTQSDGQVGYSIVSSSGVIDCPYYGTTWIGDSIKMNATSSRSYLSIPVQLKYFLLKITKLNLYAAGGIGVNITVGTKTQMSWQDSWQTQGASTVTSVEGLQKMYYSYSFGAGLDYSIFKHISIYAEPVVHGSITAINKNTPVISYPYLLGLTGGITYHF